jgi:hypothetical protein
MFTPYRETIMNRISILLLLMLVATTAGFAQEGSDIDVYASSGYVIPSSPMAFANYWRMQYGGGLGIGYSLSPSVTLIGSVEYYRFALDESGVGERFDTQYMRNIWIFNDVTLSPSAEASSVMTVAVNVRVTPSGLDGVLSPYAIAGGGLMRFALSEISLPTASTLTINSAPIVMTAEQKIVGGTETAAFLQGGLGFDVNVSETITPFVESRYVFGFAKGVNASYIPVTVGIRMRF